jgi:hypothetical protein
LAGKLLIPSGNFLWNGAAFSGGATSNASVIKTGPSTPCTLLVPLLLLLVLLVSLPTIVLVLVAPGVLLLLVCALPLKDVMYARSSGAGNSEGPKCTISTGMLLRM